MKNLSVLLAVVGTTASVALAVPRETRTFAGPYNLPGGPIGNPTINTSFTGVDGGAYVATKVVLTGTIDTIVTGTTPAQCSAFLIPPGGAEPFQVTLSGSFAAAPASVNFRAQLALPADVASVAGDWSIVLQDSTNNGAGADATVSNLSVIMDDGTIAADQTINPLADGETTGTVTVGSTEVKWVKIVTANGATVVGNRYIDISTTSGGDTEIGLYSDAGARIANDDDGFGGVGLSILTFGTGELGPDSGSVTDGFNGDLSAGTYWLAVGFFNMTFNAAGFDVIGASTASGDIGFSIKAGTFTPPPPPPPPSPVTGFGTLGNAVVSNTSTFDAATVKWFSFTTPVSADDVTGKYVDIWTVADAFLGTDTFDNDTQIGLYRSAGSVRATDDQSGGFTTNLSALTFGSTTEVRATGDINTALLNGNDGSLAADTYYLAVGGWIVTFGTGFNATSEGDDAGEVTVKVGSNFAPACICCSLSNVAGPGQNTSVIDNELTADDIIVFLNWFFAGDSRANVSGPGQNTTLLDNELTADDIIVFLNRFFAGC